MTADDQSGDKPENEDRTVVVLGDVDDQSGHKPENEDRTVVVPGDVDDQSGDKRENEHRTVVVPQDVGAQAFPASPRSIPTAPNQSAQIKIGDVLNHIFEVKRFIARGGMGEVFEGINVNSDERVAIKVILPHLAADPRVQAMFRKEAKTLTRLSHPALVQYRVLAYEPQLGAFYIVTEFIDGQNLADLLPTIDSTPAELIALTRRLAEGLSAAHALGAIHRDISPDNLMLEGGRLEGAKVIDFGIAKDLEPGSGTIIGDGFAGKLSYVAPEQLGAFNKEVGPWTDVYSLALVILAITLRKGVDMGGSLVDAVDKRRAVPNLSTVPAELRPVLESMLAPNPVDRVRTMGEVIELLSNTVRAGQTASGATAPRPAPLGEPRSPTADVAGWSKTKLPRAAALGVVLTLLLATGLYFEFSDRVGGDQPAVKGTGQGGVTSAGQASDQVAAARSALGVVLPRIPCSWLDVAGVERLGDGVAIELRGVAGKLEEAKGQFGQMLADKNVRASRIDFEGVSPIQPSECGPLEAFRQIRDPTGGRLAVAQRQFEMSLLGDVGQDAGKLGATALIDIDLRRSDVAAALFGLEESGAITPILPDRTSFEQEGIEKLANGKFRIPLVTTHRGWSGVLLITGRGNIEPDLIGGGAGSRGPSWLQKFSVAAQQRGWKSEMVWYKTVDQQAN